MLYEALELIRYNVNQFILQNRQTAENQPEPVLLGNVAFSTQDNPATAVDESAQIYMTVVNVEEEFTYKNQSAVRPSSTLQPGVEYRNPSLHLNLYILFSANHKDYSAALRALGLVLLFIQSNRILSLARTPVPPSSPFVDMPDEDKANLKLRLDLITLTFEQVNHLWGSLGGKQMPFVLVKVSKIEIDANRILQGGGIIQEIQIN